MNILEMKTAVREFFIENYNLLTQVRDIYESIDRSERYQELLRHYMNLGEKNACECFGTVGDLLSAMAKNKDQDYQYIKHGA